MINLFNTYLYQPILAVLVFIYDNIAFNDLGLSIILLTFFVRIILFPLFYKGAKDQSLMQRLQPHIQKIQLDHKADKERQAQALLELYKKHRLNPFSGFLLLLVQLPILIALYQVLLKELGSSAFMSHSFFGILDLSSKSLALAVIAALLQYFLGRMSMVASRPAYPQERQTVFASPAKITMYMAPAFTFIILLNFPSALGLYWSASTLFSLFQQVIINKKLPKPEHDRGFDSKN
ncbi:MAG: Membrane protein insertase YidC [Candidatus Jorgensenbacteria bacterium GW2011_GWA1_48_13]|uniref:Membrane protein insertase YidC n=2 Tax=Candidatus Joergenseniibacteriota TaxID=1752739 RepID=A0A0G1YJW8_9BACT|nr:MAG: Membrane protein insertase YidC [Candidatus Jorgensenbacteria bacterium GW2011_GWA1_48_13]KKU99063.1 MAG: Membrane protein insertase YidC [Candidatus Jorgensenbacteria bacterium GW2011_GWC1_48_8]KKW15297.1 MAG: Membrane protein insertase YidC [Candidatus Jorgensenbacteria bacterium GW2011_GWB1_50_10]